MNHTRKLPLTITQRVTRASLVILNLNPQPSMEEIQDAMADYTSSHPENLNVRAEAGAKVLLAERPSGRDVLAFLQADSKLPSDQACFPPPIPERDNGQLMFA